MSKIPRKEADTIKSLERERDNWLACVCKGGSRVTGGGGVGVGVARGRRAAVGATPRPRVVLNAQGARSTPSTCRLPDNAPPQIFFFENVTVWISSIYVQNLSWTMFSELNFFQLSACW